MSTSDSKHDPSCVVVASYVNAIQLDLWNEVWDGCMPVRIEQQWSGDPAPTTRHAEVRLFWTDTALYVRFVGEQKEPLVVSDFPQTEAKTIGLWDRDVCEIFLAPNLSNPQRYFEFEVAPTGEWIDLGIQITEQDKETDWDYSSGMTAIAEVGKGQIHVGMTIPWSQELHRPRIGDTWGINLFRCVGADEATRYLAWRPTRTPQPNFHVPGAFGVLKFE